MVNNSAVPALVLPCFQQQYRMVLSLQPASASMAVATAASVGST